MPKRPPSNIRTGPGLGAGRPGPPGPPGSAGEGGTFIIRESLEAIILQDSASLPNGCVAWVVEEGEFYQLDSMNPLTVHSPLIVARGEGGGRWYRKNRSYVVGNFTLWVGTYGYPGANFVYGFTPGQYAASNVNEPDIVIDCNGFMSGAAGMWDCNVDSMGNLWVGSFDYPHPTPPNGKSYKLLLRDIVASGAPTPSVVLSANSAGPSDALWESTCFDRSGDLWIADSVHGGNGVLNLLKYPQRSIGVTGSPMPAIQITTGILFNDTNQWSFDSQGNAWFCTEFPSLGSAGVIMLSAAQLAASSVSLAPAVVWGGSNWQTRNLAGLAFDSDGNLWISDYTNNQLLCYDPRSPVSGNKAPLKIITSTAFIANGLSNLVFDASGNCWVAIDVNAATSKVLMFTKASLATSGSAVPAIVLQPPSVSALGLFLNFPAWPHDPQRSGMQPSGWPETP